jgi:hypothetical protein
MQRPCGVDDDCHERQNTAVARPMRPNLAVPPVGVAPHAQRRGDRDTGPSSPIDGGLLAPDLAPGNVAAFTQRRVIGLVEQEDRRVGQRCARVAGHEPDVLRRLKFWMMTAS